jgi:predicted amidophosphoribosyltransferase
MKRSGTVQRVVTDPYPNGTPMKYRALTGPRKYFCVDCQCVFESHGGYCLRCAACKREHKRRYHRAWRKKRAA